jgi:hypothetical protein
LSQRKSNENSGGEFLPRGPFIFFDAFNAISEADDGFVAWKTKKIPTHEHKLAKIIYKMEATID